MDKYKRYYGVIIFCVAIVAFIAIAVNVIKKPYLDLNDAKTQVEKAQQMLSAKKGKMETVQRKLKQMKDSLNNSQKKIYSPIETDLGNDTLFFTLYNDVIEMVHANSVKIKKISYTYNPETDKFVKYGKDIYFVCDVDMELVSNYVNLGKLIQDIYQYPYYIKINELEVKPYAKDKKILLTNLSLRLYAHTVPEEETESTPIAPALDGAQTQLPQ